MSQKDLIKEYYMMNPNRDIPHAEIVDWVTEEYKRRTGEIFRDPDRAIRQIAQSGFLIKIAKGVYRYDPTLAHQRALEDFTADQREQIKKRDEYRCVICGKGVKDGVEIHVDHIKPKDLGGKATLDNGQVLCASHNFKKKNYKQTETGKRMFIRLHAAAKAIGDDDTVKFCEAILEQYNKFNINGHIEWKR